MLQVFFSVDLGIQHALRVRLIILSSVACLALPSLTNGTNFEEKKLLN